MLLIKWEENIFKTTAVIKIKYHTFIVSLASNKLLYFWSHFLSYRRASVLDHIYSENILVTFFRIEPILFLLLQNLQNTVFLLPF